MQTWIRCLAVVLLLALVAGDVEAGHGHGGRQARREARYERREARQARKHAGGTSARTRATAVSAGPGRPMPEHLPPPRR